ncbi:MULTISPECIES: TonB-dependent receptor domain-containing protein [Sphingomonas]|uniref:TonB-dependent receptor domain-containing protein n=1 Tax=Sphingomonas TaxID=13687 RepID=UPI000829DA21|nr:TonB-dependent receptor [Sphingomonas sp. CCH10-B3]
MVTKASKLFLSCSTLSLVLGGTAFAAPAAAQQTPATAKMSAITVTEPAGSPAAQDAAPAADEKAGTDVVVTGFRKSLADALDQKRASNQIIDAITAEDIANFPDANLAESIQRLPGVSIDRDNGEGRTITVRGLGGDFQQVRLNGADALSISGGNQSDSGANRSRGFDFNTFASELFGGITVTKSTAASNDEGSLGAIIDLNTGRPLASKKNRYALGAEAEYRENGATFNPRITALVSQHITDNFGILGTFAYQSQNQQIDAYRRNPGQFEYTYRNSQLNGITPATYGFALPSNQGTGILYGSDPAAYALVTPTTIIPALPSITRQELFYERIGATVTAQWRPTDHTEITLDGVYSSYRQNSTVSGITTIGLNRNGTNARAQLTGTAGLRAVGTANGNADRVALYANCVPSALLDCNGEAAGTGVGATPLAGYLNSLNPNNLNPFDYYNNPLSPGFVPTANQTGFYNQLIGRPSTVIRAANVNAAGQADYLVLDRLDWRSFADSQFGNTEFKQATINVKHDFTPNLHFEYTGGYSETQFNGRGFLTEFNAIDQNGFTYDERNGGQVPIFNPGFDVANPANWNLVKGLSTIRAFSDDVRNTFAVNRGSLAWKANDELTFSAGLTWKRFTYSSTSGRNNTTVEAINPTLAEARIGSLTDLGRTVGFGQGLTLQAGTPTSFFVPDLNRFINAFGIDCNCVNRYSDYRLTVDGRNGNQVTERDLSGFVQVDWNTELFGHAFRGNAGVRVANTQVAATGSVGGAGNGGVGVVVTARNEYTDVLPSVNMVWTISRNFLFRFAASKVMARPQLASLTPGTTAFPTGLPTNGSAPSITVGNPYLQPFRATNFDISFERYFGKNGLISIAFFLKDLANFPQQTAGEVPLSSVYDPATYQLVLGTITSPTLLAYTQANGVYAVRQFNDAPGGVIKGFELNVQSNFSFLPAPWDNFGVTANYTHIESRLSYLTGTALSTTQTGTAATAVNTYASAPFLNTSPDAFNATLYYEDKKFSIRFSGAYRTRYVNRFPLSTGTCSVGLTTNAGGPCNSPIVADFGYRESTFNLDFASSYALTPWARVSLEARNLTNTTQWNTMYAANPLSSVAASTGRIVTAGIRVVF